MEFNHKYFLISFRQALLYAPTTIKIMLITVIISAFFGIVIGAIRFYKLPFFSKFLSLFVTVYMGLPIMVALVLYNLLFLTCYTDFANFFHIQKSISEINPVIVALFALICHFSCGLSETVRAALRSIDKVQFEAGYSIGLGKIQTFRRIILPQILPVMVPGLLNNIIGILKATNLVSAIGVTEIMVAALVPCQDTYSYLEGYLAAALMYWIIGIVIENIGHVIEKKTTSYIKRLV